MASYDFDLPFQRCLLASFLTDDKELAGGAALIQPTWFTDEVLEAVAKAAFSFYAREHKRPDLPALREELKEHVNPGRKYAEYAEEAGRVWKRIGTNPEFYQGKAVDFARHQALVAALDEAAGLVGSGDLDGVESVVRRALQTGNNTSGSGLDYASSLVSRAERYAGGLEKARPGAVGSGLGPLDRATQGGLVGGEVGCVLGLAGQGKSTLLRQVGANVLLAGKHILHLSLENSEDVTAQMYDCLLYGKPMAKIRKRPEKFQEAMTALLAALTSKLRIKYFPQQSLTLAQLEVVIEAADPRPALVIVDYAALLKPPKSNGDERRFDYAAIWNGLRSVSGLTGIPIWSAAQANRPGMQSRKLGMEHTAECFEIPGIVDVGVSINRDESRQAEVSVNVFKNRLGPSDFEIPCSVDWTISRIKPFSDEEETT